ncbi:hypothetical protein ACRRTK_008159 [Alexandromys fortis]
MGAADGAADRRAAVELNYSGVKARLTSSEEPFQDLLSNPPSPIVTCAVFL